MALKPLNSVAGFSVGETPANIILANGDITTNNITTTGIANLNSISNVKISGGSNLQVIQTDGTGNLSFVTIDTWQIQNGNSNVQVLANSNVTVSVAGNANIATFTSSGVNVSGYLSAGNITANGNLSANNYVVTPGLTDLIIAPGGSYTRVYANLNPYSDTTYDLGNSLARWNNVFSNTANVTGNIKAGGLLTDNLYYANGQPWDLQEAAGSNYEIQFNINSNFAASANFTFNNSTNTLTVLGNANITTINTTNISSGTNAFYINANGFVANFYANGLVEFADGISTTGNVNAGNAIIGNLITANFINVSSNLNVTDTANVGNLRTDNLLHANGVAWDFQQPAGANTQIQYNDGLGGFGASANFAFDETFNQLELNGDILLGGLQINQIVNNSNNALEIRGGWNNSSSAVNVVAGDYANSTLWGKISIQGNVSGNAVGFAEANAFVFTNPGYGSGNVVKIDILNPAASNTTTGVIQANGGIGVTGNGYFGGNLSVTGDIANANNVSVTNALNANTGNFSGNINSLNANLGNLATANFFSGDGGLLTNVAASGTLSNGTSNVNIPAVNGNVNTSVGGVANVFVVTTTGANVTGTFNATGDVSAANITASGNISTTGAGGNLTMTGGDITGVDNISANSANFSSTLSVTGNANVGNIGATVGEFSGNISSLNANLGNLATANYINVANDLSVTGNITAGNLVGTLANGNSNVMVYGNANVEISIAGVPNIASFNGNQLYVVGNIESTLGNLIANGNVVANGTVNAANANVTGEGLFGSVKTANIVAPTGNITISAAGVDQNIILNPTGNGTVDVGLHKVTQVGDPTNPKDAVNKEYVDNLAQGLSIHSPVRVTSTTNLNATYADGGTALTTTDITGGKTIQFSANHGLSVGDEIYWTNSFNGIISNDAYFVYSTPAANQITIKAGFYGTEVTTLTNGTGLTQPARGNPGVGATLTNAGANAALSIDSISLASTNRVLVQGQTNQFENGVYEVTTVGNGSTAWVLTRAADEDQYDPKSTTGLAYGDYFFVQQGTNAAGSSYVLTSPVGEIVFGVTNIGFSQFSASGSYTAGNGIAITGTIISANVDGVTTDIVGGNIVVKAGANLTTPNVGDASFQSLSWNNSGNGNVTANNLSIGNVANISGNLTVSANIQATYDITSNANISSNNSNVTNFLVVGSNITGNNISSNNLISTTNANISSNLITNNATVNLELSGNTANFSGNVIVPNLTVNLALAGNTANFSGNVILPNLTVNNNIAGNTANFTGNISAANANLGNLATANFFTGTLINGTSNVAIPTTNGNVNITAGGNTSLVVTATGANVSGNLDVTGNLSAGNFSVGTLSANTLAANISVGIGNTTITWDTVTTTSVTANQTIASLNVTGITGLEFLVKAVDSVGSKYSIATVQAVTDGTSVDYATFGTVQLGGYTGSLAVNVVGGFVRLQVTPASSNSTVWTTQARTI